MSGAVSLRQPFVSVPLRPGLILRAHNNGLATFKSDLPLWLEISPGRLSTAITFRIDSGCEISSVGIDVATAVGMPVPPTGSPEYDLNSGTAAGTVSVRVRPGRIRAWWTISQQGEPFDWPILFILSPSSGRKQKALLGLGGVITTCTWTLTGPSASHVQDGHVAFADVRPI